MHLRLCLVSCLITLFAFAVPASADTPVAFGAQLNIANDFDFGVGGRATFGTESIVERTRAVASFDFYFPDGPVDFWELNFNGHYLFDLPDFPAQLYAGTGLHLGHASVDVNTGFGTVSGSSSDVGLNLLGGVEFNIDAPVQPFAELKIELGGAEQFIITGGLMF